VIHRAGLPVEENDKLKFIGHQKSAPEKFEGVTKGLVTRACVLLGFAFVPVRRFNVQ